MSPSRSGRYAQQPKFKKQRNVFRIETRGTVGWQVRVQRQGQQHTKFFADRQHGGVQKALRAAVAYRDALQETLPPPEPQGDRLREASVRQRAAEAVNRSGVLGVGFSMKTNRSGGRTPYVQGYWADGDGRRRSTSYSAEKHGLEGALRLVCRRLARARADGSAPPPESADGDEAARAGQLYEAALPGIRRLYRDSVSGSE